MEFLDDALVGWVFRISLVNEKGQRAIIKKTIILD